MHTEIIASELAYLNISWFESTVFVLQLNDLVFGFGTIVVPMEFLPVLTVNAVLLASQIKTQNGN